MIVVLLLVSTVAFVTEAKGTDSPSSSPSKAPNSTAPTSKPVPTPIQRCLFGLAIQDLIYLLLRNTMIGWIMIQPLNWWKLG
jgi:hypothetical protein